MIVRIQYCIDGTDDVIRIQSESKSINISLK